MLEIYNNIKDYGKVNIMLDYDKFVMLLKYCNKNKEYYNLLSMLKSCNITDTLTNLLIENIDEYRDIVSLNKDDVLWKNNKSGIITLDYRNKINYISVFISKDMLYNLSRNCKDKEYKELLLSKINKCMVNENNY